MRIRGDGQNAALAEQSPAPTVGSLDTTEVRAPDMRNAVVLREPLVDERVRGGQQLEYAAVLEQDTARK